MAEKTGCDRYFDEQMRDPAFAVGYVAERAVLAGLPEDIAEAAAEQVVRGRFASVEDVLRAGIAAVQAGDPAAMMPGDWEAFVQHRFEAGRAAFARGEAVETTADEFMDSINAELGLS